MSTNLAWMEPVHRTRKSFYITTCIAFLILMLVVLPRPRLSRWHNGYALESPTHGNDRAGSRHEPSPREKAANATLGFEKLLALSTGPSWRTRGLLAAAEFTGLQFEIPTQPQNPPETIKSFQKLGPSNENAVIPKEGSAKAWLAHLDLIKYAIAREWQSVLIVEDDVDWDIRLLDQMRLVSDNVRQFVGASEVDPTPYGHEWDILWLGHCGEVSNQNSTRLLHYEDDTRPTIEQYAGWSKPFLRKWMPKGARAVQDVSQPVCSFAYAFTRQSAQRLLNALSQGNDEAFDVALQHHCVRGNLRCISINPEIMHHYQPDRSLGYVSQVKEADGTGQSSEEADFENVKGATENIVHSARCTSLFNEPCLGSPWELNSRRSIG